MSTVRRLPMIMVLVAVLVGGVVFDRTHRPTTASTVRPDTLMPSAQPAGSAGSTWYCAAGSATGDSNGFAEQTVSVANSSDEEITGQLTAVPDKGDPVVSKLRIAGHSRQTVRISDLVRATWASALVELSGGEVTVAQLFQGPSGRSAGACASAPAQDWYFPSGSTRNGARNLMALFNPFPGEATVDITFDTEDGSRAPQQFDGLVLPGGRVSVVDVGAVVTLREQVSTSVHARAGRVVAQQIQTADGREGGEQGLTVTLGATSSAMDWFFPVATPADSSAHEVVSVLNPGEVDATVEVQVQVDDAAQVGSVEPYRLSVPAGRSASVDLMGDARIPRNAERWLIVHSTGGTGVVAARSIGSVRSADTGGLTYTLGVPVAATNWLATFGNPVGIASSVIAIANPSAAGDARVTVTIHGAGSAKDIPTMIDVVIASGERRLLDLTKELATRNEASITISSDQPVVVGQLMVSPLPIDLLTPTVYPLIGSMSIVSDPVPPQVVALDDALLPSEPTTTLDPAVSTTTTVDSTSTTLMGAVTSTTIR
ncbi:MAG: hypothetical protein F2520_05850 [Actinobacteria bacterium]|uniref:Unannotated protein n=1 Tax=freshwater metagenome TaxID=449393 RepID=A0A6J5YG86_9ZZZZ|nr:hypothetical protein [Actinomycetota bacterium]MTA77765.1 hypothetical protein [Actinomycetota bacterium]